MGEKGGEKVGEKTGEKVGESLGELDKLNLCPFYLLSRNSNSCYQKNTYKKFKPDFLMFLYYRVSCD